MEPNICIVTPYIPPDFAGAGKRAYNQARYLDKCGFNITIITTTRICPDLGEPKIISINVPTFYNNDKPTSKVFRHFYNPMLFLKIIRVMLKHKFNIVHCIPGDSWFSLLSIVAGKILGSKVIVETTLFGGDDPISIRNSHFGLIKFKLFSMANTVINISPLLMETCANLNIKSDIKIIANSVDIERFNKVEPLKKRNLRDKLGLPQNSFILLYVGVISERKGIETLIEMMNTISNKIDNIILILAGPINNSKENSLYYNMLNNKIADYNLSPKIFFTGEVTNPEEWMQSSDIFVFASKREGFGTVLIEAMGCGLPVITKRINKITDFIIENGNDGIVVNSLEELTKSIILIYKDKDLYEKISRSSIESVAKRFSEEVIMKKYIDVYTKK